jgi:hypothetical protein
MSFTAKITADIANFEKGVEQATRSIDGLQKNVEQRLSGIGKSFENIGKKASVLSAVLVAAGGKAYMMAADFEDALGATGQIFKENADIVRNWSDNLGTEYGIAKKEALEYSNLMGSMLINIGRLTEQEAAKQSAKLIELAGDLTAMYGGRTQDAVRALTGALKGNNTMLDNYGMAVNDALIKTRAFELGLSDGTGELSLQAKQAATLSLIFEQTGAAQGQAAREADGASGSMRALRTEITNLSTELGQVLIPVITPVISGLRDIVAGIRTMSPEMQTLTVGIAATVAAIGPLLVGIGKLLQMLPLLKAGFVALTGPIGLVGGAIILLAANFEDVVKNVTTMWNTFTSGISSSVKALVSLVTLDFKGFWTNIKSMVANGVKWVVGQMEFMGEKLEWVLRKLGLEEWANRVNASFGGINLDQAALEAALAANEMTGSAGAMQAVKKEAADTAEKVDKLTSSMKELTKVKVPESIIGGGIVIDKQKKETIFDQLFSEKDGNMVLKPIIEPTIEPKVLKDKMMESVKSAMGDLSEGIQVLTIDLSSMLAASLTDIFGAVSEAIVSGDNVMEALGSALLGTMGGIMVQLGQQVIATGAAIEAVKLALTSLGGLGAIAAGAALIAIGSMFKAGARKIGSSMGSGGYSSAPSMRNTGPSYGPSEYRGQYQDDFKVEFKIGTNELVGVLNTAEQRRNRL